MARQPVDPLSDGMRLLAACCEHPRREEMPDQFDNLASRIADWEAFSRLATRHQVQGFVANRLSAHQAVPARIRERWMRQAQERTAVNLRQARATGELHALLHTAGIENLVLKGLPLALKAYGTLSLKRSSDIDLLVREEDAEDAAAVLGDAGYRSVVDGQSLSGTQVRAVMRHHKEVTLTSDQGIVVDLHWRLVSDRRLLAGINPFANSATVTLGGIGAIATLGEADEFAYLCAHGAFSDWSRFKWLVDLNALVASRSEEELLALHAHADQLGAGASALQALGLREIFWDHRVPAALREPIDRINCADLFAFPLDRMAAPYRPDSFRQTIGWAVRKAKVSRVIFGSAAGAWRELGSHLYALPDMLALPLPQALDWLYPILRPAFWLRRRFG